MTPLPDTTSHLFNSVANMKIVAPVAATATIPLQLYYGPNEYKTLQQYNNGMENIVNLGSGFFRL